MRRYLQYHELLRDIRLERVMEVMFFSQPYDLDPDPPVGHPEGPCLVLYKCASLFVALTSLMVHRAAILSHPVCTVVCKAYRPWRACRHRVLMPPRFMSGACACEALPDPVVVD